MTTSAVADQFLSIDSLLEQTLRDIGIPPRPEILDRIAAEMRKDDPSLRQIGLLVSADVSLAAGLIKTANSPFFGLTRRAQSANDALMMLGLDRASRAIAGISVRRAFPADIRLERFWDASAKIATLSGWLSQLVGNGNLRADDAHTFGLFRDCGIPAMLRRFPAYDKILARANGDGQHAFTQIEQQELPEFPTDHAMIGCLLAQNWQLPAEFCTAIRHHHDLSAFDSPNSGLPMHCRTLIATSQTAEHILQTITGRSCTREWDKLGDTCLRVLGCAEVELQGMYESAARIIEVLE